MRDLQKSSAEMVTWYRPAIGRNVQAWPYSVVDGWHTMRVPSFPADSPERRASIKRQVKSLLTGGLRGVEKGESGSHKETGQPVRPLTYGGVQDEAGHKASNGSRSTMTLLPGSSPDTG